MDAPPKNRLAFDEGFSLLTMFLRERIIIKTVTEWSPEFGFIGYLQDVTYDDHQRMTTLHFDEFRVTFKHLMGGHWRNEAHWDVTTEDGQAKLTLYQHDATTIVHKATTDA